MQSVERNQTEVEKEKSQVKHIKCVIWDLDNTLWNGVLLEDETVTLKDGIVAIIKEIDKRGILQSIASRNNEELAMNKLKEFGLDEYFLYPQINWENKSNSVQQIAKSINISLDTLLFIDDQPFERDEVNYNVKEVTCFDPQFLNELLELPIMNPKFVTEDSKMRRFLYLSDIKRNTEQNEYTGTEEEFLAQLHMKLTISEVMDGDLQRAEELTVRTHQLNATGYTYSYEELDYFRTSENHLLLIAELQDKYGTYGKIGLVLIECSEKIWTLKLMLMSCRVMSRGVGSIVLGHVIRLAQKAGVELHAEFVSNDVNRMMYITYRFSGFKELSQNDGLVIFKHDYEHISPYPQYLDLCVE